ncbi:hypothetical protein BD779DRAFT_1754511 [Infundibulicybe gibba]|nr:hypothetical protein BD779DRAFT_1754511 [Infundibulicybe gibba]
MCPAIILSAHYNSPKLWQTWWYIITWWREIGLSCPSLWSHIDYNHCRSAAWMATMIERSLSVPLSVVLNLEDRVEMDQKMALVLASLHRFQSLNLRILSINTQFLELFSGSVPLLEHLEITYLGHATFVFPFEFLSGSAPNLRHIGISTLSYIPWTSGLFANLVTLQVCGNMEREPDGPEASSLEMLLSALAKMPGLETLLLRYCFSPPKPSATIPRVHLPNLKVLRTSENFRNSICFFKQVTFNPSAVMDVLIMCDHASKHDADEFFAILPSHPCQTSSLITQELKFDWLCFQSNVDIPTDEWDAEVWRKVARMCPDLRRLAVRSIAQCMELCDALSPPNGQDLVPADCCFPALSYLEVPSSRYPPAPISDEDMALLFETLSQSLSRRAAVGCPTPELVLVSPFGHNIFESWSKQFRDAVPGIIVRERRDGDLDDIIAVSMPIVARFFLLTLPLYGK